MVHLSRHWRAVEGLTEVATVLSCLSPVPPLACQLPSKRPTGQPFSLAERSECALGLTSLCLLLLLSVSTCILAIADAVGEMTVHCDP